MDHPMWREKKVILHLISQECKFPHSCESIMQLRLRAERIFVAEMENQLMAAGV